MALSSIRLWCVYTLCVACHGVEAGPLLVVMDASGQRIVLVDRGLERRRYLSVSGRGLDLGERGELLDSRAAAQGGLWFAGVAEAQLLDLEALAVGEHRVPEGVHRFGKDVFAVELLFWVSRDGHELVVVAVKGVADEGAGGHGREFGLR